MERRSTALNACQWMGGTSRCGAVSRQEEERAPQRRRIEAGRGTYLSEPKLTPCYDCTDFFLDRPATSPARPVPSSSIDAGSGAGELSVGVTTNPLFRQP